MATSNKDTALAVQETQSGFLALADSEVSQSISEELAGLNLTFDRIKVPSAGSTTYELPTEDGDTKGEKEFSAVILYQHPLNWYYRIPFDQANSADGNPPDCSSIDGVTGIGDPGGSCAECPLNEFESGKNGGKACQNRRVLYLLREGEFLPIMFALPATSLKDFRDYLKRLLSNGNKSNSVVTRFSLRKATSKGGKDYSIAQFGLDRRLSPEEYALIKPMTEQVKAYSRLN